MNLTDCLGAVADGLCSRRNRMLRLVGSPAAECETLEDFRHFAMVAAFNALLELGGDPDDPDTWPAPAQLLPRARTWLARDLQSSSTTFGDFRARYARRDLMPHLRWDSWRGTERPRPVRHIITSPDPQPQEVALEEGLRGGLFEAVREVLNEYEAWVVYEHFWRGRTVRDIAKAVADGGTPVPSNGEPFVPHGRVEKRVQKLLQRALERAAARLGDEWRTLAAAA